MNNADPHDPEFQLHPEQFRYWAFCQRRYCKWFAERGTQDHEWYLDEWNEKLGVRVIRCPWHWSYWSLERTIGKSKVNLATWDEALIYANDWMNYPPEILALPYDDLPLQEIIAEHFPINLVRRNVNKSNYGNMQRRT